MKILCLFALFALAGCVARPTLQELEYAALRSGDWSQVEKRERALERRQFRNGPQCPDDRIAICDVQFGDVACSCADRDDLRRVLGWR